MWIVCVRSRSGGRDGEPEMVWDGSTCRANLCVSYRTEGKLCVNATADKKKHGNAPQIINKQLSDYTYATQSPQTELII